MVSVGAQDNMWEILMTYLDMTLACKGHENLTKLLPSCYILKLLPCEGVFCLPPLHKINFVTKPNIFDLNWFDFEKNPKFKSNPSKTYQPSAV